MQADRELYRHRAEQPDGSLVQDQAGAGTTALLGHIKNWDHGVASPTGAWKSMSRTSYTQLTIRTICLMSVTEPSPTAGKHDE